MIHTDKVRDIVLQNVAKNNLGYLGNDEGLSSEQIATTFENGEAVTLACDGCDWEGLVEELKSDGSACPECGSEDLLECGPVLKVR